MLQRLTDFAVQEGLFEEKALGELDKSCCRTAAIKVFDFDKTKEMLSRLSNKQQPKSADALKILPILKRIDFIELKSFKEFFEHHKDKPKLDQRLSRQVERFDLETKIHDSLFVMELLSRDKKLALTNEEKITL